MSAYGLSGLDVRSTNFTSLLRLEEALVDPHKSICGLSYDTNLVIDHQLGQQDAIDEDDPLPNRLGEHFGI